MRHNENAGEIEVMTPAASTSCRDAGHYAPGSPAHAKMIALGFYDGPTAGVLECAACFETHRFLMVDRDNAQERLAPI